MSYPAPQIGYYYAECCLLDLYKIETPEDLHAAQERVADNGECGALMVFRTLDEAVAYLRGDGMLEPDEEAEQLDALVTRRSDADARCKRYSSAES